MSPVPTAPLSGLLAALSKALSASSASALPPNIPVIWASLPKPGMSPDKAAADAEFWLNRAAAKAQEQYKRQAQMVMVVLPDRGGVGGCSGAGVDRGLQGVAWGGCTCAVCLTSALVGT